MMVIENKYEIGQKVFLTTDPDQYVRVVTSLRVYAAGEIIYSVACGAQFSDHYDFEISAEKKPEHE